MAYTLVEGQGCEGNWTNSLSDRLPFDKAPLINVQTYLNVWCKVWATYQSH